MANSMWGKRLKLKLLTINILRTTQLQLKSEHFHSYGNVYCNGIEIGVVNNLHKQNVFMTISPLKNLKNFWTEMLRR